MTKPATSESDVPREYMGGVITSPADAAAVASNPASGDVRVWGNGRYNVLAPQNSVVCPLDGTAEATPSINNAIVVANANGGGVVDVPFITNGYVIKRKTGSTSIDGGIKLLKGVSLRGYGAKLILRDNCHFITGRFPFGQAVNSASSTGTATSLAVATVTADFAVGTSNFVVDSSAGFTVGDEVFFRFGDDLLNPAGSTYETIEWGFAKVSVIPDGTHLTLDRPIGYALTVASTTAGNRQIFKTDSVLDNFFVDGFELFNDIAGGGNAEAGISLSYCRNGRIDNIAGTNPGSGIVTLQYAENFNGENHRVRQSIAQGGQTSKGRVYNFAEASNVDFRNIAGIDFERTFGFFEGYSRAIRLRNVYVLNNNAIRGTSSLALFSVSSSEVEIEGLRVEGNGGANLTDRTQGIARLRDVTLNTTPQILLPSLVDLEGIFRVVNGTTLLIGDYGEVKRWSRAIRLDPNLSNISIPTPAGLYRRVKVYVSSTTGITGFTHQNNGNGSSDFKSSLSSGVLVDITLSRAMGGIGSGYMNNFGLSPKQFTFTTDGTAPVGGTMVIEIEYFVAQTALPSAVGADDLSLGIDQDPRSYVTALLPWSQLGDGWDGAPTYGTTVTPASNASVWQTVTVTDGVAFTIAAPATQPSAIQSGELTIEISNTSGGAMGVITWNATYVLVGGAFVNPATAKKRFITFKWNGTKWVEVARAGADY